MTVPGVSLPDDLFARVDTMILNVSARKITGLGKSARTKSLHVLAGTHTFGNLLYRHCTEFLDSFLHSTGSSVKQDITKELRLLYGVNGLGAKSRGIVLPADTHMRVGISCISDELRRKTAWQRAQ